METAVKRGDDCGGGKALVQLSLRAPNVWEHANFKASKFFFANFACTFLAGRV